MILDESAVERSIVVSDELFQKDAEFPGMRLQRVELLNWGGFTDECVSVDLNGDSVLLTGLNRSGKTTILDAIVTLICQRPKFGQAVEEKGKGGRSIATYVLGKYSDSKLYDDYGSQVKANSVRDRNTISIILGYFSDSIGHEVTAIQWFYFDGKKADMSNISAPKRRCCLVNRSISISHNLLLSDVFDEGFSLSIDVLNERIRNLDGVELFPTIEKYLARLREYLHISEKGLNSIANTIKVTKVDNINDYVRDRLEQMDFSSSFISLLEKCQKLNVIHQKIKESQDKRDMLTPLVTVHGVEYKRQHDKESSYMDLSANLEPWLSKVTYDVCAKELVSAKQKKETLEEKYKELSVKREEKKRLHEQAIANYAMAGGNNKETILQQISFLQSEVSSVSGRVKKLERVCKIAGLSVPVDLASFRTFLLEAGEKRKSLLKESVSVDQSRTLYLARKLNIQKEIDSMNENLSVLLQTKGNIDPGLVQVRDYLVKTLGLGTGDLPFAGELMDVMPKYKAAWEGAINKLMHSLATTILVPYDLYDKVPAVVESIKRKRIPYEVVDNLDSASSGVVNLDTSYASGRVCVKQGASMTVWLAKKIRDKYAHKCCTDMDDFKRERFALSLTGQRKYGSFTLKDDVCSVDDPRFYVIGSSNEFKVAAIRKSVAEKKVEIQELDLKIASCEKDAAAIRKVDQLLFSLDIESLTGNVDASWKDYDSESAMSRLREEQQRLASLENDSSLKRLEQRKELLGREDNDLVALLSQNKKDITDVSNMITVLENEMCSTAAASVPEEKAKALDAFAKTVWDRKLSYSQLNSFKNSMTSELNSCLAALRSEHGALTKAKDALLDSMHAFLSKYPNPELSARVDLLGEFESLLQKELEDGLTFKKDYDDLFTRDFVDYLSTFKYEMRAAMESLKNKIDDLNRKLREVEFRKERGKSLYMKIDYEPTGNRNIIEFRSALDAVTKDVFADNAFAFDKKSGYVMTIIDFLRNWSNKFERDRKAYALDIRNWFVYALEVDDEDGNQVAYYSSTSGDSTGGQQSIASFLLVVSQLQFFNLAGDSPEDTFRFVIMDELNESCDHDTGNHILSLLRRFGFQAVYVTPGNKIQQVSPYVGNIYQCRQHDELEGVTLIRKVDHFIKKY